MVAPAGAPQDRAPQRDGEIPGTSTPRAPGVARRRRDGMAQAYFVRDKMAVIHCILRSRHSYTGLDGLLASSLFQRALLAC